MSPAPTPPQGLISSAYRFATLVIGKQSGVQASGTLAGLTTTIQHRVKERRPMQAFQRINFDPQVMAGQACIRGMRVTAALIIRLIA